MVKINEITKEPESTMANMQNLEFEIEFDIDRELEVSEG